MAKKKAAPKKAAAKKAKKGFTLSVTNLKFIGAAFDVAIDDLRVIKGTAKDRAAVQAKIDALTLLKTNTAKVCPQSWWVPFES